MVYMYVNTFMHKEVEDLMHKTPQNMHAQIHLEVFHPSQTGLASWQCGKLHLEKTRLLTIQNVVKLVNI